ncbi:hypothetical protein Bbelb_350910 [Branchiostoma belcheri]|nr:hypothetical protein Bbelb_350910 [Branchiostoma belcheri]
MQICVDQQRDAKDRGDDVRTAEADQRDVDQLPQDWARVQMTRMAADRRGIACTLEDTTDMAARRTRGRKRESTRDSRNDRKKGQTIGKVKMCKRNRRVTQPLTGTTQYVNSNAGKDQSGPYQPNRESDRPTAGETSDPGEGWDRG